VTEASPRPSNRAPILAVAILGGVALAIVGRDLGLPGLYYDEVIQAEPAVQFLAPDGVPSSIPGAKTIRLFGGWFPVAIQPYMGALKSQALIPVFAAFGPSAASLRGTTLALAAIGLLFAFLWVRRTFGLPVAAVATGLLVTDPSFLYISRHDWGSFALAFLCRCGALYFLTRAWTGRSAPAFFAGGLLLGLGVYNKIDFGVFVAGAGLALLCVAPRVVVDVAGMRVKSALAAVAGFVVGAGPVIAGAAGVLSTTGKVFRRQAEVDGDWVEKFQSFGATLDGSYFQKLMLAGGSFERMFDVRGATEGVFGIAFALAFAGLGILLWRDRTRGGADRAEAFAWCATLAIAVGLVWMPRSVRIHHALNLYPFPHLVVAIALVRLGAVFPSEGRRVPLLRGLAAAVAAGLIAFNLVLDLRTATTIRESGGKGRWSDAIGSFAEELAAQPGDIAVGMDWGFAFPLRFAARELPIAEPVWALRGVGRSQPEWHFDGTPRHVYLVFDDDLAVFEFGPRFLARARALSSAEVTVRRHLDREGDLAFLSVRFSRPHRLVYRDDFEVEFR